MSATENLNLPENEMHTTAFWLTLERALSNRFPSRVSERQSGMFGLLHALESIATLLLMCDGRDLGTAIGERPPSPGSGDRMGRSCRSGSKLPRWRKKEFFEPNFISLRRLSRRNRILRAAVPRARSAARKNARTDRRLRMRKRLPSCVGPAGDLVPQPKKPRWQSSTEFPRDTHDKFARLSALKPGAQSLHLRSP